MPRTARHKRAALVSLAAFGLLLASDLAPARPPRVIYLQPLGGEQGRILSRAELAGLRRVLRMFFPVRLRRLAPLSLPPGACAGERGCRARALLDALAKRAPRRALRIIGVTRAPIFDIYGKHGLGFAAGLGQRAVVISTAEMKDQGRGTRRLVLAKVMLHELGHAFGLDHCADPMCLMAMGAELAWMDDFCPRCRAALARRGFAARRVAARPWPSPKRVEPQTRRLLRRLDAAGNEIILMPDRELERRSKAEGACNSSIDQCCAAPGSNPQ